MKKIFSLIIYFLIINNLNILCQEFSSKETLNSTKNNSHGVDIPTGTFNYSIPIYKIKKTNFTLPISINTSCRGVKVDQLDSRFGLGWNLSCGGVITRVVRGYTYDENYYGIFHSYKNERLDSIYNGLNNNLEDKKKINKEINERNFDGENDIFYLNLNGKSVEFLIKKDTSIESTIKVIPINYTNIDIKGKLSDNKHAIVEWVCKDEYGNEFIYSEIEYSLISYQTDKYNSNNAKPIFNDKYAQSWFLSKVKLKNGEEINYKYYDNVEIENDKEYIKELMCFFERPWEESVIYELNYNNDSYKFSVNKKIQQLEEEIQSLLQSTINEYYFLKTPLGNILFYDEKTAAERSMIRQKIMENQINISQSRIDEVKYINDVNDNFNEIIDKNYMFLTYAGMNEVLPTLKNIYTTLRTYKSKKVPFREINNISENYIAPKILKKITFDDNEIIFNVEKLRKGNAKPIDYRIKYDNIIIKNSEGRTLNTIKLNYKTNNSSSFSNITNYLKQVNFVSDSLPVLKYQFDYYHEDSIINKKDKWQYPCINGIVNINNKPDTLSSNYRSLKQITEPNGRKLCLIYENNTVGNKQNKVGGLRIKTIIIKDFNDKIQNTIGYCYNFTFSNGHFDPSGIIKNETIIQYDNFRDKIISNKYQQSSLDYIFEKGNNGVWYDKVLVNHNNLGKTLYCYANNDINLKKDNIYRGINKLPIFEYVFDKNNFLVKFTKKKYKIENSIILNANSSSIEVDNNFENIILNQVKSFKYYDKFKYKPLENDLLYSLGNNIKRVDVWLDKDKDYDLNYKYRQKIYLPKQNYKIVCNRQNKIILNQVFLLNKLDVSNYNYENLPIDFTNNILSINKESYYYDSKKHNHPTRIEKLDSKGNVYIHKNKFAKDYNLDSLHIISKLVNNNENPIIESQLWIKNNMNNYKLIKANLNEYKHYESEDKYYYFVNTDSKYNSNYNIVRTEEEITKNNFSSYRDDINKDYFVNQEYNYKFKNNHINLSSYRKLNNITKSFIYDKNNKLVLKAHDVSNSEVLFKAYPKNSNFQAKNELKYILNQFNKFFVSIKKTPYEMCKFTEKELLKIEKIEAIEEPLFNSLCNLVNSILYSDDSENIKKNLLNNIQLLNKYENIIIEHELIKFFSTYFEELYKFLRNYNFLNELDLLSKIKSLDFDENKIEVKENTKNIVMNLITESPISVNISFKLIYEDNSTKYLNKTIENNGECIKSFVLKLDEIEDRIHLKYLSISASTNKIESILVCYPEDKFIEVDYLSPNNINYTYSNTSNLTITYFDNFGRKVKVKDKNNNILFHSKQNNISEDKVFCQLLNCYNYFDSKSMYVKTNVDSIYVDVVSNTNWRIQKNESDNFNFYPMEGNGNKKIKFLLPDLKTGFNLKTIQLINEDGESHNIPIVIDKFYNGEYIFIDNKDKYYTIDFGNGYSYFIEYVDKIYTGSESNNNQSGDLVKWLSLFEENGQMLFKAMVDLGERKLLRAKIKIGTSISNIKKIYNIYYYKN